jgi:RNA polymerase sigma-70 factor (ECF subfamily)
MFTPHQADYLWHVALESASEVCKTTQIAEDAACHAFNYVIANQDKYDGRPLRNWVGIIARNKALSLKRELKRYSDVELHEYHLIIKTPDAADHSRLHAAINTLKPKDQEVLRMHYFKRMELKAIAESLGTPESTVKVRIMRARTKLKNLL